MPLHRLPSLSVVLTGRPNATVRRRAVQAAEEVSDRHEILVLDGPATAGSTLAAAALAARHDWLLLVDAADARALEDVGRLVAAAPGHALVAANSERLASRRPPARRRGHREALVHPNPSRRRAMDRRQALPSLLVRTNLARRLGDYAGKEDPLAGDLAVLAVLLGKHVAIIRAGASAAILPRWRAPGAA